MPPHEDETRLLELLVDWEERRRYGETPTPDQLCPDDPDLREALRRRLDRREKLGRLLDLPGATAAVSPAAPPRPLRAPAGYEIVEVLGHGGMGVVYRARQVGLNRPVALKMILAGAHAGAEQKKRFRAEAETIAQVQHPNIVQVHEVGEVDGCPFLALELVEGGSLAQALEGRPMPVRAAAHLLSLLARAVQHAHQRGIIHRDLKPANVLLARPVDRNSAESPYRTPEGVLPKIVDFGVAKRLDGDQSHTQTGTIIGSPSYMAPEQAEGRNQLVGPATDVYSLGAILYELLTGRPPFLGATFLETLDQVRGRNPVPPRALQPKVPRDLEAICLKCLEKKPADRYLSAADLADDLDRFQRGEATRARSLSLLEHVGRSLRHTTIDPRFAAMSRLLLRVSPLPLVTHVLAFFLFRDRPWYAEAAVATTGLTALCMVPLLLWANRALLLTVPIEQRRQAVFHWVGHLIAMALVPLTFWFMGVTDWFLVYPVWIILAGMNFFALASAVGFMILPALACFALALPVALAPTWSPLEVGVVMAFNLISQGLFLRGLDDAAVAPKAPAPQPTTLANGPWWN